MDAEVKVRWVSALESGAYEQGRNRLTTIRPDGVKEHCCLGVLCDLYGPRLRKGKVETGASYSADAHKFYSLRYDGAGTFLPDYVQEHAGLADNPVIALSDEDFAIVKASASSSVELSRLEEGRRADYADCPHGSVWLSMLNDTGVPFSEIARLIRKYL